eukprot:2695569-Pleurochrysis_carterae.AAC.4
MDGMRNSQLASNRQRIGDHEIIRLELKKGAWTLAGLQHAAKHEIRVSRAASPGASGPACRGGGAEQSEHGGVLVLCAPWTSERASCIFAAQASMPNTRGAAPADHELLVEKFETQLYERLNRNVKKVRKEGCARHRTACTSQLCCGVFGRKLDSIHLLLIPEARVHIQAINARLRVQLLHSAPCDQSTVSPSMRSVSILPSVRIWVRACASWRCRSASSGSRRRRARGDAADAALDAEEEGETDVLRLDRQPACIENGKLRPYQVTATPLATRASSHRGRACVHT